MKLSQEELDRLKCLYKVKLEKLVKEGFIDVNPFKDVSCKECQNYHSAILCGHYVNTSHLEYFKRLNTL